MQPNTSDGNRLPNDQFDKYPALASLRLTANDLQELARQGFVSREMRGPRSYYKLRFRSDGRQAVRYIGGADQAKLVLKELAILQADSKLMRDLGAKMKLAKKLLREIKQVVEPLLEADGYAFHGLAIRRPRQKPDPNNSNINS